MKIAIVGSGIAGLTCAYLLAETHDITLFEANDYLGGHTHTVSVSWQGESHEIDTGFIVYNERTYPHFIGLLNELGVATQPTLMGFSVSCRETGFEYNGTDLLGLIADKRNLIRPRFYRMMRDVLRFYRQTREFLAIAENQNSEITVGEFARQWGYSRDFVHYHLLPMGAAIWSCGLEDFAEFPFRFVARFYDHHGLIQVGNRPLWRVLQGGSRQYIERMRPRFADCVRLSTPVQGIERTSTGSARVRLADRVEEFEHVILACHADTALRLRADADETERELLSQFPYARNTAILHTDATLLPRHRRAWASWNYLLDPARTSQPTLTYYMNMLQGFRSPHAYCVTLNDTERIAPERILGRYEYDHPLFSTSRDQAQRRHAEMIGRSGISYCGAYWRNGFHEDGVISALRVCQQWNISPRWSAVSIQADV